jgi:hypothetical protein
MGATVTATCSCGVELTIPIGGGMQTFTHLCSFPCLCPRCKIITTVNLLDARHRCPKCRSTKLIPYDDPSLSDGTGSQVIASWNMAEQLGRELVLTDSHYHCPQCGQMTLRFRSAGLCWD